MSASLLLFQARRACAAHAACRCLLRRARLHASRAVQLAPQDAAKLASTSGPVTTKPKARKPSTRAAQSRVAEEDAAATTTEAAAAAAVSEEANEPEDEDASALAPTGVEAYLNSLKTAGLAPSLADLERCRPARHSAPDSAAYAHEFGALGARLARAFSKAQLRAFCVAYAVDARARLTKPAYVLLIIERAWGWPSLAEIQRRRLEQTVIEQGVFAVTPSQLFLILGQDGAELLQLSVTYNVHIALKSQPLQLEIEGVKASVSKLLEKLSKFIETIVEDTFDLPTGAPIRADLVQRLSRLAGAFIENVDNTGKIRICAVSLAQLQNARRLVTRTVCEALESSRDRLLTHIPPSVPSSSPVPLSQYPDCYSVYPFLSPHPLPWTMNLSGAFRIRKVSEWLGPNPHEDVTKTGGLAGGRGKVIALDETAVGLRDWLLAPSPDHQTSSAHPRELIVTACVGHMLINSSSMEQRASIMPPMKGFTVISRILKWLQDANVNTIFLPSLPSPRFNAAPSEYKTLLRMIYRTLPDASRAFDTIRLEVTVPTAWALFKVTPQPADRPTPSARFSGQDGWDDVTSQLDPTAPTRLEVRCWQGRETSVDVMLPDRPLDIRFSAFDCCKLEEGALPSELRDYVVALYGFLSYQDPDASQPIAPLTLAADEKTYILNAYKSVRQNLESVPAKSDRSVDFLDRRPVQVLRENIVDIESRQRGVQCQLTCQDAQSPEDWEEFLHDCDHLSSMTYRPIVGRARLGYEGSDDDRISGDE